MLIHIHRGAEQIGGNCIELVTARTRILVDIGLPLDFEEKNEENRRRVKADARSWMMEADAIFISHAHGDHYGLLSELDRDIPVFMSQETKILIEANPFNSVHLERINVKIVPIRREFSFRDIQVTAFHVDHSAYGACAYLFRGDGKSVLYSGDIRIHGRKGCLYRLLPKNPDCLLLEGTNAETEMDCPTEKMLVEKMVAEFKLTTDVLHIVWCSGQNIDRIVTLYKACKITGKKLVIDPYTATILNCIAELNSRIPNPNSFDDVFIYFPRRLTTALLRKDGRKFTTDLRPKQKKVNYQRISLAPQDYVLVVRESVQDFLKVLVDNQVNISFTISNWEGYWEEDKMADFRRFIEKNCQVTPIIHTSGHSNLEALRMIIKHISPKCIIPIHTEVADDYRLRLGVDTEVYVLKDSEIFNL